MLFAVLVGTLTATSRSAAEGSSNIAAVAVSLCDPMPFDEASFESLLSIEIANDGYVRAELRAEDGKGPGEEPVGSVHVRGCGSPNPVVLLRAGAQGEVIRERTVDLSDVAPAARPRVLAIAMAELMRTAESGPPPQAAPVGEAPKVAAESGVVQPVGPVERHPCPCPRSEPPARRGGIGVALQSRLVRASTPLMGVRALGLRPLAEGSAWLGEVDVGAEFATVSSDIGDVSVRHVSAGAAVLVGYPEGQTAFFLGPRVEIGYADAKGESASPTVIEDSGGGTVLVGSLEALVLASFGAVDAMMAWDLGWAATGTVARVDGSPVVGFDGPHVAVRLGMVGGL
jgi:hypothetical protein